MFGGSWGNFFRYGWLTDLALQCAVCGATEMHLICSDFRHLEESNKDMFRCVWMLVVMLWPSPFGGDLQVARTRVQDVWLAEEMVESLLGIVLRSQGILRKYHFVSRGRDSMVVVSIRSLLFFLIYCI